jgi:hypothetical protein
MRRDKPKLTQLIDKIDETTYCYEIERLTPQSRLSDKSDGNYADQYLVALQREKVNEDELMAILNNAIKNRKWIHMADVWYHTDACQRLLHDDPKQLICQHAALLIQRCPELNEEYHELLLVFICAQTDMLSRAAKVALWETLFREAVQVSDDKEKTSPMQAVIDHLFHYLCGYDIRTPLKCKEVKGDIDELLKKAQKMRERRLGQGWLPSFFWWQQQAEQVTEEDKPLSRDQYKA